MGSTHNESAAANNKAVLLVKYLMELASIDAKIVRKIEDYEKDDDGKKLSTHVVWLHEIPHVPKYCFARAWGEEHEGYEDIWIEVKKCDEPLLPEVPEECRKWVNSQALRNTTERPKLNPTIVEVREDEDPETGEVYKHEEILNLNDFPRSKRAWDDYVRFKWTMWRDLYVRYHDVQQVYSKLFQIHQEQQRLGEQYELIVCLGLLTWLTPSGHAVRRHLIAARSELEFEARMGKFTVRPPTEGAQTAVEFDMLELEHRPVNAKQLAENGSKALQENPWDRSALDPLLHAIANSFPGGGEGKYYHDNLEPMNEPASTKPIVEFAPALVLRKRSLRGLQQVLDGISKQISADGIIPHGFLDLCETVEERPASEPGEPPPVTSPPDRELYFPLQVNDEQGRIIEFLGHRNEVLVQGPPGTGKSHTIANLICHLLATDQRVLVTAKTPRALQVLHGKLPTEIGHLCINLLGSGTEERKSLELSVSHILAEQDKSAAVHRPKRIEELERRIREKRESKAQTDNKIRAIRESETCKHAVANGSYDGTAAQIAKRLREEEPNFSWFEDRIAPDVALLLSNEELGCLRRVLEAFDSDYERQLTLSIPDPDADLPGADTIRDLFEQQKVAQDQVASTADLLKTPEGQLLLQADFEVVENLASCLKKLSAAAETLRKHARTWIKKAVDDVLTGDINPWRQRLTFSSEDLDGLRKSASDMEHFKVTIPKGMDRSKALSEALRDATAVKEHLKSATIWSRIFPKKEIRQACQRLKGIEMDGLPCSDVPTLEKLIKYLELEQELNKFWSRWSTVVQRSVASPPIQVEQISELLKKLKKVLELDDLRREPIHFIHKVKGLTAPKWEDNEDLLRFIKTCRAVLSKHTLDRMEEHLQKERQRISEYAACSKCHPIVVDIRKAFEKEDIGQYRNLVEKTKDLRRDAEEVGKKRQIVEDICRTAPKLAASLTESGDREQWAERLNILREAWAWAQATRWLDDYLNADLAALERDSLSLAEDIRKDIEKLAAEWAWHSCLDRMQDHHRQHLEAWRQARSKYGKGTGKHAHVHLKNAQRHLNECKDAVPAWIMPLHRVYETVEARPGTFDIIIVDEASQCGPESLPLLYLGKRILVVGDDQQISPEAVGVDRTIVHTLMGDYLRDFQHRDSFDVDRSLFDHGRIRFGNRITLREHFRCMPEIINFSNDLCYFANPLIPLRQYGPSRLEPIQVVRVESGYKEGKGQQVINRPEAEALAAQVERCCRDQKYLNDKHEKMTMGVIVLQGQAQAYVIEKLLLEQLGAEEMAQRKLICGHPYSFQGDERDIIFLSMVAAPNEPIGVLSQAADQRRFNVAVSRAKDQIWLFHSATVNDLSEHCLRRRLLEYFYNPRTPNGPDGLEWNMLREKALRAQRSAERPPQPFDSWFEVDVALDIHNRGYTVIPQFEVADKRIDLVVQGHRAQLAVECYGDHWHGPDHFEADMRRQRKLERCKWHFFIVRESFYRAAPEKALEPLWGELERRDIRPVCVGKTQESGVPEATSEGGAGAEGKRHDEEHQEFSADTHRSESEDTKTAAPSAQALTEGWPSTIEAALTTRREMISRAIIEILQQRPNNSCKRAEMLTLILQRWSIRTRGRPRQKFAKKVDKMIAEMERQGYVTVYKSKNIRIKPGPQAYPRIQMA
ncbi:MAG: AAA domain-containing protein [Thermodesulfobacteriota bacterium]